MSKTLKDAVEDSEVTTLEGLRQSATAAKKLVGELDQESSEREAGMTCFSFLLDFALFIAERVDSIEISQRMMAEQAVTEASDQT